jgi:hypothetical protein
VNPDRTPEQIEADANLSAAIDRVREVYGFINADDPNYLAEFVVVFATTTLAGSGSSPGVLFQGGGMPGWKVRGLLTQALEDLDKDCGCDHGD